MCHALALRHAEAGGGAAGIGAARGMGLQQGWTAESPCARLMTALVNAAPDAVRFPGKGKQKTVADEFPEFRGETFYWSRAQSLKLAHLNRTLQPMPLGKSSKQLAGASDIEREEFWNEFLNSKSLEELSSGQWEKYENDVVPNPMDSFWLVHWDAITGDRQESFTFQYESVLQALQMLWMYESERDRHHRVKGAFLCNGIGKDGSGDQESEELRGKRFRQGIKKIGLRILQTGYKPSDAADIVALCNHTLHTLHMDYAGYARDLLIASDVQQQEELRELMEIGDSAWEKWQSEAELPIEPVGAEIVIAKLGDAVWQVLTRRSHHFLTDQALTCP
jgi:hypothetical protein